MTLRKLLEEQDLVHWNINSHKNVTNVVIRFAMPGQYSHTHGGNYLLSIGETERDLQILQLHKIIVIKELILTVINTMKIWILLMKIVHRYDR